MKKKVLCIIGTRPEVIKMAPIVRALRDVSTLDVSILSSGQHREMLVPLLSWFEIGAEADLNVMTANQSLSQLTARLMRGFEQQLSAATPDLVLAQGDTTTVLCAALSCFYRNIPFAHVEAGLRTYDARNPFPEEFNRVAVSRMAQLHFCPTARSRDNVLAEHVEVSAAHLTGNTVIDALRFTTTKLQNRPPGGFDHNILLTAHRRENFGPPLVEIFDAVLDLCREFPQIKVLYPVHPNPNVKSIALEKLGGHGQIRLVDPLDYPDLIAAMQHAAIILTDSGGIQEEAPALSKPVLVLRIATERPEAVELGVAKIVGPVRAAIVTETRRLLLDKAHYERMAQGGSPYGDGQSAARIRDIVCRYLQIA
jgi:UDP-N-acetylglucosamine 2-epimerase (non-hydrolysing)